MNNIVLTGMPGAGKSTIGVLLAKVLGYKFIDADILIQNSQGMLLREIIAKYGDDGDCVDASFKYLVGICDQWCNGA